MKIVSITKNNDFRRVYQRGKCIVTPSVVIYALKNKTRYKGKYKGKYTDVYRRSPIHIGITTSKKIGNAVMRNRSRRVIREAVREIQPCLKQNYDYVFVARGKTPYVKSTIVKKAIVKELKKAGFFEEAKPQKKEKDTL